MHLLLKLKGFPFNRANVSIKCKMYMNYKPLTDLDHFTFRSIYICQFEVNKLTLLFSQQRQQVPMYFLRTYQVMAHLSMEKKLVCTVNSKVMSVIFFLIYIYIL